MSETNKNVVITKAARVKMLKARAGDIPLPKIVKMAFGNGGVDSGVAVVPPVESQTGLTSELLRKDIDSHSYIDETTCRYSCELLEAELAGQYISEIGLVDEDGDVLCIKTFSSKGKDDDVRQTYTMDDVF